MKSFWTWLEDYNGDISNDILDIIAGDSGISSESEKTHLLGRRTTEFGSQILDNLKNLGVLKNIANDDLQRYTGITAAIKRGVTIQELIRMIQLPTSNEI